MTIWGIASKQIVKILEVPEVIPENLSLMDFLRNNEITIASSCSGVGTCQKCIVNKTQLSCQITLQEFSVSNETLRVEISYL